MNEMLMPPLIGCTGACSICFSAAGTDSRASSHDDDLSVLCNDDELQVVWDYPSTLLSIARVPEILWRLYTSTNFQAYCQKWDDRQPSSRRFGCRNVRP
jgi:hypothetical protein